MRICLRCLNPQRRFTALHLLRFSLFTRDTTLRRVRKCQSRVLDYEGCCAWYSDLSPSLQGLGTVQSESKAAPLGTPARHLLDTSVARTPDVRGCSASVDTLTCIIEQQGKSSRPFFPVSSLSKSPEVIPVNIATATGCAGRSNSEQVNCDWSIAAALFGMTNMQTHRRAGSNAGQHIAAPSLSLLPVWARKLLLFVEQEMRQFETFHGLGLPVNTNTMTTSPRESSCKETELGVSAMNQSSKRSPTSSIVAPQPGSTQVKFTTNAEIDPKLKWCDDSNFHISRSNTEPVMYMTVLGRPKIVRFLLYHFLSDPTHWRDHVDEVLQLANQKASAVGEQSNSDQDNFKENISLSEHLLQSMKSIVFYTPGLCKVLRRVLHMTPSTFTGPMAIWYAFVIAHRGDATLLCSPQEPPFGFSEVYPNLIPEDFKFCRFLAFGEPSTKACETCKKDTRFAVYPGRQPLESVTEEEWRRMSEKQQNELLFGKDAVCELGADAMVTARDTLPATNGIFFFNPPPTVSEIEVGDESTSGLEKHSNESTEQSGLRSGTDLTNEARQHEAEMLEKEQEALRLHGYEPDQFLLGIIEWSFNSSMSAGRIGFAEVEKLLAQEVQAITASSPALQGQMRQNGYYANAMFRNTRSGEVEDVHLSRLWESFQEADTSVLLGHFVQARSTLYAVQQTLRTEMASQAAFLLLFFSTDEVRAITDPKDTYYRLWRLHQELVELLAPIGENVLVPPPRISASVPPFESLSADEKLSYACWSYINRNTTNTTKNNLNTNSKTNNGTVSSTANKDNATSPIGPQEDPRHHVLSHSKIARKTNGPFELFCDYCVAAHLTYSTSFFNKHGVVPSVRLRDLTPERMRSTYESLTPLQKFAFSYCFPKSVGNEPAQKLSSRFRYSNAEVRAFAEVKIPEKDASTLAEAHNRLARVSEWEEATSTKDESAVVCSITNSVKSAAETIDGVADKISRALRASQLEGTQAEEKKIVHGFDASSGGENETEDNKKLLTKCKNFISQSPSATTSVVDAIRIIANAISEADLPSQIEQISSLFAQLITEVLRKTAAQQAPVPRSSRSHLDSQRKLSEALRVKARKRGRPSKRKPTSDEIE